MIFLQDFSAVEWSWSAGSEMGVEGAGVAEVGTRWTRGSRCLLSTVYWERVWSVDGKYDAGDFKVISENMLVLMAIFKC